MLFLSFIFSCYVSVFAMESDSNEENANHLTATVSSSHHRFEESSSIPININYLASRILDILVKDGNNFADAAGLRLQQAGRTPLSDLDILEIKTLFKAQKKADKIATYLGCIRDSIWIIWVCYIGYQTFYLVHELIHLDKITETGLIAATTALPLLTFRSQIINMIQTNPIPVFLIFGYLLWWQTKEMVQDYTGVNNHLPITGWRLQRQRWIDPTIFAGITMLPFGILSLREAEISDSALRQTFQKIISIIENKTREISIPQEST